MGYSDIVLGINGETSPLSVQPSRYYPLETDAVNLGTNSSANGTPTAGITFTGSSLTKDAGDGTDNSAASAVFDGASNIAIPSSTDVTGTQNERSFAMWCRSTTSIANKIRGYVLWRSGGGNGGASIALISGSVSAGGFRTANSSLPENNPGVLGIATPNNQPTFIAITFSGSGNNNRMRMYQDGVLINEETLVSATTGTGTNAPTLGGGASQSIQGTTLPLDPLIGEIGHLMIFGNYELTQAEVLALYNAGNYVPPVTYTLTLDANVDLTGAEIRIYDLDDMPAGSLGTELAGVESCPTPTFAFNYSTTPNSVWIQILKDGFVEFGQEYTLTAANVTLDVRLQADGNA